MKTLNKVGLQLLLFMLVFQSVSVPIHAMSSTDQIVSQENHATILTDEDEDEVHLFAEESDSSETLTLLKGGNEVTILEELDDFSHVQYIDEETNETITGFVPNDFLTIVKNESPENDDSNVNLEQEIPEESGDNPELSSEATEENPTNDDPTDIVDTEANEEGRAESIDEDKSDNEQTTDEVIQNEAGQKVEKATRKIATENQTTYNGIALKSPTKIYQKKSTRSKALKSYAQGTVLKYESLTSQWYEATVYVNGKYRTGYIHANDVENLKDSQSIINGVALKSPTKVYQRASTKAKALKSYAQGTVLKYESLTSQWYEATVYVNGKYRTGYIHANDVENLKDSQSIINGVALKSPTKVYQRASTKAKAIKSYTQGSILMYKPLTSQWYEATVYVNGKSKTGYINKSDVEDGITNQEDLKGIGLQNPTRVYSKASTGSKKLKSYAQGTILNYKTFSSDWYEATIYINGKPKTGYIRSSHVESLLPSRNTLEGRALGEQTPIYSRASKHAKVIKSYKKHSILKFKSLSRNWHEVTVFINGKRTKGYLHANDVTAKDIFNITKYDYTLKQMVDTQMTRSPKSDGSGKTPATRSEVEYYVNPINFTKGTSGYLQFLDLRQSAGMNAKEVNDKVLYNKGILKGTGQAFIDASHKYNINEAYLISHTLHETGNGTSTLAKGVPVDESGNVVAASKAVHTVYNMYGYGAYDSCVVSCGAKYAFEQGWFTPSAAITGGAGIVANNYIERGQDTLYKMRWNPVSPGYPQYATHVAWAVIQTNKIHEIYQLIDNYTLVFDVPKFKK